MKNQPDVYRITRIEFQTLDGTVSSKLHRNRKTPKDHCVLCSENLKDEELLKLKRTIDLEIDFRKSIKAMK